MRILSLIFDKAGPVKGSSILPIWSYRLILNKMSDLTTDGRTRYRRDGGRRSNRPGRHREADPAFRRLGRQQAHEDPHVALRLLVFKPVPYPLGCPSRNRQAHLTALERAGDEVLEHLDELVLGHPRVDVDPKPAMHVAPRRHHFAQPALRLLDGFGPEELVRKHHFRIDHPRYNGVAGPAGGPDNIRVVLEAGGAT